MVPIRRSEEEGAEADARVDEEEEHMQLAVLLSTRRRAEAPGSCHKLRRRAHITGICCEHKKKSRCTWQLP